MISPPGAICLDPQLLAAELGCKLDGGPRPKRVDPYPTPVGKFRLPIVPAVQLRGSAFLGRRDARSSGRAVEGLIADDPPPVNNSAFVAPMVVVHPYGRPMRK